jgi:lipopolysaccharide export system protein LptA
VLAGHPVGDDLGCLARRPMSDAVRGWVRRISAGLIVIFVVAVSIIGYQRTQRGRDGVESVGVDEVGLDIADVAVGLYRGFSHTETLKGQPVFILNSLRTLSLASGWQEIEGVRLQLFRESDEGPVVNAVVTAEKASFNIETRDARLVGGIHVEFPSGAFLNTESGEFNARRRYFSSDAPVLYVDGPTFGQAQTASYDLDNGRIRLDGSAVFRAEDGSMLTAPRMLYERDERRVVFPVGAHLTQALSRMTAPRAVVWLSVKDGPPERIELSGGVDSVATVESTGGTVELWAERVVSERDAAGNWQVDARTTGPWVDVRFIGGPSFFERRLRTMDLDAVIGPDGILGLQSSNGVCLEEIPIEGAPRTATADNARAWFNAGQLTDIELRGQVEIRADDIIGRGQRVRLIQGRGLAMFQGDPTGRSRVELDSARGRISCDQAIMYHREDRIEATGQVHGELYDARLLGSEALEAGDEPMRFAGALLEVAEDGDRFELRDDARIWQGHRLLLADEVVYQHGAGTAEAAGHVRATFPADQLDPAASGDDDVVVVSRSLLYDSIEGSAVFRGAVHYTDPKHSLSANRLEIQFDDNDDVSDVEAEGAVEIRDLELGRRLTGQHAVREVESQVITVTGSPAQLIDPRGNIASGESLTWNQADGTVSIGGGTELIYYPEEAP